MQQQSVAVIAIRKTVGPVQDARRVVGDGNATVMIS
jgi:hypothetical protein